MKCLLDNTRRLLESKRAESPRLSVHMNPPPWMRRDDPLQATYADQAELLRHGDVVWAVIVQAPSSLFSPGKVDFVGDVTFSPTQVYDRFLDRLFRAGNDLFALREQPGAGDYQAVRDYLCDESARAWRLRAPISISNGEELYIASIVIHRAWMPLGYLGTTFLPVLVSKRVETVMMLPSSFWADDLLIAWKDLSDLGDVLWGERRR